MIVDALNEIVCSKNIIVANFHRTTYQIGLNFEKAGVFFQESCGLCQVFAHYYFVTLIKRLKLAQRKEILEAYDPKQWPQPRRPATRWLACHSRRRPA